MDNHITCPYCHKAFEPTDAYKHELEEKVLRQSEQKFRNEISRLKQEKLDMAAAKEKEMAEMKRKVADWVRADAEQKIRKELESKITTTREEAAAREKQNKELQEQMKELFKELREQKDKNDKISLEYEKKLLAEQDKLKLDAKKEAEAAWTLQLAEKDKQLSDFRKANAELTRKLDQKSQQLQGEVQELRLEELLKSAFPFDEISEVPKGQGGADAIQIVRSSSGAPCGIIVWESKRAQRFDQKWFQKLLDDQRSCKGDIAVLVTNVFPDGINGFGMSGGIFITDLLSAISVAALLREQLIKVHGAHAANSNKSTKAEIVYNYLISNEFKQKLEVWVEYFRERSEKINKEKVYFTKKWQEEEKSIQKVMATTSGIYGDLQGLIGNALPKVGYFELPEQTELDIE